MAVIAAAQEHSPEDVARQQVLDVLALERTARLNHDARMLVSLQSDPIVVVQDGTVTVSSSEAMLKLFRQYFTAVRVLEWEDLEEPRITLSQDNTMAVVVMRKRVTTIARDANDDGTRYTWTLAWTAIYELIDEQWVLTHMTTTRAPEEIS